MNTLHAFKKEGWKVVGTNLSKSNCNLVDIKNENKVIICLGNEGKGLRTNVLNECDWLYYQQGSKEAIE